jgi:UrcA family protein
MPQFEKAIVAAAVAAMMLAPSAYAEPRSGRSVSVSYDDLDLSRPDHARAMAERIDEAARSVCGGSPRFDPNYRSGRAAAVRRFETCRAAAVETALAELQAPLVARALADG